jgi:hypothetical protein
LKPVYTIFSRVTFLNVIAILIICFSLQMTYYFVLNLWEGGWNYYFSNSNFIVLVAYALLLVFDVWILTASILPVIKIDDFGISAYSIFWRRNFKWNEIASFELLKSSASSTRHAMSVSWSIVQSPFNKVALGNKGIRVNTFILIHKHKFKMPKNLSLMGLLSHNKIVDKEGIAFEYSEKAERIILEKLGDRNNNNVLPLK